MFKFIRTKTDNGGFNILRNLVSRILKSVAQNIIRHTNYEFGIELFVCFQFKSFKIFQFKYLQVIIYLRL